MLSDSHPRADPLVPAAPASDDAPLLQAPSDLVARYLQLTAQRRAIEEELSQVRSELEMAVAAQLTEAGQRGRFVSPQGVLSARLVPTCTFDRQVVPRELQRAGRLADVAVLTGPALARFLAKEPVMAARLGEMVRFRKSVTLIAGSL